MSTARPGPAHGVDGLQAERTGLAWSRTSLGAAANAALLAVREVGHAGGPAPLVAAGFALVVAVATGVYGRRRTALLRRSPLPAHLAPTVAVPVLGWSVVFLGLVTGAVLMS